MSHGIILNTLSDRIRAAWRDAAAAAAAGGIAWTLAVWLFGNSRPLFAAVTAIVCLAPGLPNHGRQAVGLLIGVATGILVGEAALLLPEGILMPAGPSLLRMTSATLLSMLIAVSFGLAPVVAIQAGVSAVMVLSLGPADAGLLRLEDVALGVTVGLVFSQILITPDPVRQIDKAADGFLMQLARAFEAAAEALELRDAAKAEAAVGDIAAAHDSLINLGTGIDLARQAARWSVRGRLAESAVSGRAARYDRHAIRLYSSALLFGEAIVGALRNSPGPAPAGMREAALETARRCARLAEAAPIPGPLYRARPSLSDADWHEAAVHLRSASDALAALEELERPHA
ncbi:MAG: FUSC family protein [Pseudochelatococcus sp.]|jgi:uncharacterized membrane protein YgaE (UPF0421/DUF939 family)|uniref:FUSC family protein n=1 Tax=Pseudochelatococcus sp. TaxID=2020869 RepID=UPI003D8C81AE